MRKDGGWSSSPKHELAWDMQQDQQTKFTMTPNTPATGITVSSTTHTQALSKLWNRNTGRNGYRNANETSIWTASRMISGPPMDGRHTRIPPMTTSSSNGWPQQVTDNKHKSTLLLLRSCPNRGWIWIGDVGDDWCCWCWPVMSVMVSDGWSLNGLWLQLWCCTHNRYGPVFQNRDKGRRRWLKRHEFK